MRYELELYSNDMSIKTEKIEVEGTAVSALDTSDGAMFMVLGSKGAVVYVTAMHRVKSMRAIGKQSKQKAKLYAMVGRDEKEAPRGRRAAQGKTGAQ